MLRIEPVNQFEGWGNDTPQSSLEHFYSKGFSRLGAGAVAGRSVILQATTAGTEAVAFGATSKIAKGTGRDATNDVAGSYLFVADESNSHIYQSDLGIGAFENVYMPTQNWFASGLAVDQKGRLLYPGWRYLGMFDPTVANHCAGTVSVTNGSATVTGTGTTFVAGDVGKRFKVSGVSTFYTIATFVSATQITLNTTYSGTTNASASYMVYRAWTDQWKDFGSELSSVKTPIEIYEDTVLFGRNNNILSLNVTTDTITTDASPAFSMPSGYVNFGISANSTGILLAFNYQGRGTLVLWDNYSDRSIAPWIRLDDSIIGMARYGSGWLVMTTKTLYYTNGYSLTIMWSNFLFSTASTLGGGNNSNFVVRGDSLFFGSSSSNNKRRGGLYKLDLKTMLLEFYGGVTDAYDEQINSLYYDPDFARLYVGFGGIGYLNEAGVDSSKTYSFITNEVGFGDNWKYAEAIRVPVSISKLTYTNTAITFKISAKINTLDRQLYNFGQTKSAGSTTTMVVDETVYLRAEVGDEIEWLTGNNKGKICNILSIAGGGTNTATYTLDKTLGSATSSSESYNISGFKLIEEKSISGALSLPDLYFGIKNRYKAKKYMIKFVITDATVPVELKPFQFIFDDQGAIQ